MKNLTLLLATLLLFSGCSKNEEPADDSNWGILNIGGNPLLFVPGVPSAGPYLMLTSFVPNVPVYIHSDYEIVDAGPADRLSDVVDIPETGWELSSLFYLKHGYFLRTLLKSGEYQYARFFVQNKYIIDGILMGFRIRHEYPYVEEILG